LSLCLVTQAYVSKTEFRVGPITVGCADASGTNLRKISLDLSCPLTFHIELERDRTLTHE
jgi:hypothetical protein